MKSHLSKLGLVAALGALAVGTAFATPIEMTITTNGTTETYTSATGTVNSGSFILDGWDIHFTTGTSYSPSMNPFALDLSNLSVECVSGSCKSLTIALTDTDYAGPIGPGGLMATLTGSITGKGQVNQWAYQDPTNTAFGESSADLIGIELSSSKGHGIGMETMGGPGSSGAFSLTIVDVLAGCSGNGCASYSLDNEIVASPEPGTLALFGAGLLGCAIFVGRRRRASRPQV